jgi:predicted phage-related endonuclease
VNAHSNILGDGDDLFRANHVGASEVAALFDASPWLTKFELYHRKAGTIATPDFGGNERIEAGIRLEPAIIEWACDKWGYAPDLPTQRLDNGAGLGGHPDRIVVCPERGRGILEVKTADWLVAKGWGEEPPLNYQLQVMTYVGLAGCEWGDLIMLIGGNELRRFQIEFRPKLYAEIEARVAAFWHDVEAGRAPKPDYTRDGDTISALHTPGTDETIDLKGDNLAAIAAAEWLAADEACKAAAQRRDAARAELAEKLGEAGTALLEGFVVKSPTVKASPDIEITPAMAGQIIKGRKAHRRFSVKELT